MLFRSNFEVTVLRTLLIALFVPLAVLQAQLWFSEGGYREVWHLRAQASNQEAENQSLLDRNIALEAEVIDLKEGLAAAEERARTDLGMIRREETFFQVIPAEQVPGDR
jgi:cell division protein FtsB